MGGAYGTCGSSKAAHTRPHAHNNPHNNYVQLLCTCRVLCSTKPMSPMSLSTKGRFRQWVATTNVQQLCTVLCSTPGKISILSAHYAEEARWLWYMLAGWKELATQNQYYNGALLELHQPLECTILETAIYPMWYT